VVLLTDAASQRLIAHCDPDAPSAWRRGPIYTFLKEAARATWRTGMNVIAIAASDQWLITPTDDLELGRIEPGVPYRLDELPGGDMLLSIVLQTREGGATEAHVVKRILKRQSSVA
jgi:hypothetical protein